jgi:hypothetical protein
VKTSGLCTRILGKLDEASFPFIAADQQTFEWNGVRNAGEAKGDGATLQRKLAGLRHHTQVVSTYPIVIGVENSFNFAIILSSFGKLVQGDNTPIILNIGHFDSTSRATLEVALQHATDDVDTLSLGHKNRPLLSLLANIEAIGILVIVFVTRISRHEGDIGSSDWLSASYEIDTFDSTAMDERLNKGQVSKEWKAVEDNSSLSRSCKSQC